MAAIDQEIIDHRITYEQLKEFLGGLNQCGFRLSVKQYTTANRLLLGLISNEWILQNPRSFRTYLAPVVCSSASEQQEFYRLFDEWFTPLESAAVIDVDEVDSRLSSRSTIDTTPNPVLVKRNLIKYAVPVLLLIGVFVSLYVWLETTPRTLTVRVVQANNSAPIANAQVSFAGEDAVTDSTGSYRFTYRRRNATPTVRASSQGVSNTVSVPKNEQSVEVVLSLGTAATDRREKTDERAGASPTPTPGMSHKIDDPNLYAQQQVIVTDQWSSTGFYLRYFLLILAGVVALPFTIYLGWQVWLMLRRRQLERWRTREQPELFSLTVRGVASRLYRSPAFRTFAQELRRHRRLKSNTLDASASVNATASAGGLFTPVYEYRQITPDYLLLVDAQSFQDQKAHLNEEIIKRLQKEGVFVDQYYFNSDPRVCQSQQPKTVYRTLEQMAARHPDHRLVLFSDGAGLIDPLSGRPHSWIEKFSQWPIRALITPEPNWSYREWALQQTGLAVLPAAEEGFVALGRLARSEDGPHPSSIIDNQTEDFYPPRLLENPKRWIARKSPPAEEIEELGYELRYYLGHEGFYLLCACAVYPALIWDLTLYYSSQLVDSKNVESVLGALVRLPWFRTDEMPDWLRSHLISRLPPPREATVRKLLEQLLISYVENPKQGFDLEIVREPPPKQSSWRKRLDAAWQKLRKWKQRKFFQDVIRTAPHDSPFRDYIFLNVMSRSKLAVLLPLRLRRLLYSKGQPILGLDPVRALVLPLVVAIVGGVSVVGLASQLPLNVRFDQPTPTSVRVDASGYRILSASYQNLPLGSTPPEDLRGKDYSKATLTSALDVIYKSYEPVFSRRNEQIANIKLDSTVVDPTTCQRELNTDKCVAAVFTIETRSTVTTVTQGFKVVDGLKWIKGITDGPVPPVVADQPYTFAIINLDRKARTVTFSRVGRTGTTTTAFRIFEGQDSAVLQIGLDEGLNSITISDGQQIVNAQIRYDRNFSGTIRVNVRDQDGAPVQAQIIFYGKSNTLYAKLQGCCDLVATVPRVLVEAFAEAPGYQGSIMSADLAVNETETLDFRLTKLPTPTPTPTSPPRVVLLPSPTLTPTPTPVPVSIAGLDLTFNILKNDKDDGSVIIANILLDGKGIQTSDFGRGVTWKSNTSNKFTLTFSNPIPATDCNRMALELVNKREEPGSDTWEMQVVATLKLSDGRTITLTLDRMRLQGTTDPFPFPCPATPAGPGML